MAEFIELANLGEVGEEGASLGDLEESTSFNTPRTISLSNSGAYYSGDSLYSLDELLNEGDIVEDDLRTYRKDLSEKDFKKFTNPEINLDEHYFDNIYDHTEPKTIEALNNYRENFVTFNEINSEGYRSNFRGSRDFSDARSSIRGSSFRSDRAPKGAVRQLLGEENKVEDFFYTDYAAQKTGQGFDNIFSEINNIYNASRAGKEINRQGQQIQRNRRVLGIVLSNENRDDLISKGKIPAYYSTKNIKSLLRDGIMPFGWNAEMAVQQGFGDEVAAVEHKVKSREKSVEFLQRESAKAHLKATEGDLKNLRNRLKTRKLIQYYSQF